MKLILMICLLDSKKVRRGAAIKCCSPLSHLVFFHRLADFKPFNIAAVTLDIICEFETSKVMFTGKCIRTVRIVVVTFHFNCILAYFACTVRKMYSNTESY